MGILALMFQDFSFLLTAVEIVQPGYFETPEMIWAFQKMRDYYQDYKARPDVLVMENELRRAVATGRVKEDEESKHVNVLSGLGRTVDSSDYVIDEVVRFCRRQAVRKTMLECAPLAEAAIDDNVWDSIQAKMTAACQVGSSIMDIGTQYFQHHADRLKQRMIGEDQLIIPVGIPDVDVRIGGGLKSGQLGLWMGTTGGGKSIALPHCGKRAIFGGFRVAHYTLELNEESVAERYDASWTGVPIHDLREQNMTVAHRLEKLYTKYGNSLIIKHYPSGTATLDTIKQHLHSLRGLGFIPDLIIVDYADLLKPLTKYDDSYEDLGAIILGLRGLAGELKIPIWSATQSNRTGHSQEVMDVDMIGDSFKKAQIADIVIAICANPSEIERQEARLFLAKNRNGPQKHTVKIKTAYDRMVFYAPTGIIAEAPPARAPVIVAPPPKLPTRRKPRSES